MPRLRATLLVLVEEEACVWIGQEKIAGLSLAKRSFESLFWRELTKFFEEVSDTSVGWALGHATTTNKNDVGDYDDDDDDVVGDDEESNHVCLHKLRNLDTTDTLLLILIQQKIHSESMHTNNNVVFEMEWRRTKSRSIQ